MIIISNCDPSHSGKLYCEKGFLNPGHLENLEGEFKIVLMFSGGFKGNGELLCILQWLMETKKTAASGTRSRHIEHFFDSAKSCGNARRNCACALKRLSSAVVFTKNWQDTNIGNITKGISVTWRTCKLGTTKKLSTVHKRRKEA